MDSKSKILIPHSTVVNGYIFRSTVQLATIFSSLKMHISLKMEKRSLNFNPPTQKILSSFAVKGIGWIDKQAVWEKVLNKVKSFTTYMFIQ